jgi:hypothetical protein
LLELLAIALIEQAVAECPRMRIPIEPTTCLTIEPEKIEQVLGERQTPFATGPPALAAGLRLQPVEARHRVVEEHLFREPHSLGAAVALPFANVLPELDAADVTNRAEHLETPFDARPHIVLDPPRPAEHSEAELPLGVRETHHEQRVEVVVAAEFANQRRDHLSQQPVVPVLSGFDRDIETGLAVFGRHGSPARSDCGSHPLVETSRGAHRISLQWHVPL